ncbi:MAG: hypothetical protein R3C53_21145 [Pirellulaceae bacterium]
MPVHFKLVKLLLHMMMPCVWLWCCTGFAQPAGRAAGEYGADEYSDPLSGGGAYGDMGGGMYDDMGGYGGVSLGPMTIQVPGPDGKEIELTSKKNKTFRYQPGSLRVEPSVTTGYEGEEMMGGYGGGMAAMGDMMGMDAGMGAAGMPGMTMGMPGPGMGAASGGRAPQSIHIVAYIFPQTEARERIELVIPQFQDSDGSNVGGIPGISMAEAVKQKKLPGQEAKIVEQLIGQTIWKAAAIEELNRHKRSPEVVASVESRLREILTEAYETQLARQALEITNIEQRISQLRNELTRRQAAKARVVDVQLGNIVLQAQGLLGQ